MEPIHLLPAKNRDELRAWLMKNAKTEKECWVCVKRGRPRNDGTFWYIDAVEEAMCFGWIDSTTKRLDTGITAQRLAPRRKGSLWSELNKEWEHFQTFPPLYQRVRIDTIQIKKNDPALFQSRLTKLIENSQQGILYGEWNDNGRLIDY